MIFNMFFRNEEPEEGSIANEASQVSDCPLAAAPMATDDPPKPVCGDSDISNELPHSPALDCVWSGSTLSSLLGRSLPDCTVDAPQVVIMGAQSSGKTLLVISMVFGVLINLPAFTDEMGDSLLSLLQTGPGMVTKRPIQIDMVRSEHDHMEFSLQLGDNKADFTESTELFNSIREECMATQQLRKEPLIIRLANRGLSNHSFLDLPGLSGESSQRFDNDIKLADYLLQLAHRPKTVIAVVETAYNMMQEPGNCRIVHLLKDALFDFSRCVLVLSQCDKVVSEDYSDLSELLQRENFKQKYPEYPFGRVVGVINNMKKVTSVVDSTKLNEPPSLYKDFRGWLRNVMEDGRERFRSILGLSASDNMDEACTTKCSTQALFEATDGVVASLLFSDLKKKLKHLREKQMGFLSELFASCAPPGQYYWGENKDFVKNLCAEFRLNVEKAVFAELENWFADSLNFCLEKVHPYLGPTKPKDLLGKPRADMKLRNWLENLKTSIESGVIGQRIDVLFQQQLNSYTADDKLLVYPSKHTPCRFPALARSLERSFRDDLPQLQAQLRQTLLAHVDDAYSNPSALFFDSGRKANVEKFIGTLLHKVLQGVLKHCAQVMKRLSTIIEGETAHVLWEGEKDADAAKRQQVYEQLRCLLIQSDTAKACIALQDAPASSVSPLQRIRDTLEKGEVRLQEEAQLSAEWQDRWWREYLVYGRNNMPKHTIVLLLPELPPSAGSVSDEDSEDSEGDDGAKFAEGKRRRNDDDGFEDTGPSIKSPKFDASRPSTSLSSSTSREELDQEIIMDLTGDEE